ncbi:DoxX family membrane protein [Hymenobacter coccineus]|uniref:DoxX family protein n=1 Tax=Hymenobacter coccineus TaxID=1908235 RepID=A0A1G1SYE8_9BACT|nr:DoxX family membrane protein [Hymenobacter coccineus]OGX83652.1 hypothetical protein BEN49_12315 [Hymenobacter coccineus]
MPTAVRNLTRAQVWDYMILAARVLLAGTFISYGYAKLTGAQFGLVPAQLAQPVQQLGLFKLSWYLFGQEPFKSFVGYSQIVAGLLLLWHRTALVGALVLLPIAANVLVVDLTYLKILPALQWRLVFYLGLIFLICWHYRSRMHAAWRALTQGLAPRFPHPWWAYALLPVAAVGLDVVGALPHVAYVTALHPAVTWRSTAAMVHALLH